jgi:type IV pilus biogenesis/stability protein PilW
MKISKGKMKNKNDPKRWRGFWGLSLLLVIVSAGCQTSPQVKEEALSRMRLGDSLLQEGKATQALGELLQAAELDPGNPVIQNMLGIAYLEKGLPQPAAEAFKKALELDPKYVEVRNNLGTAYLRTGRIPEAVAEFTRALESPLYATPHFAYYNRGQAYLALKDYGQARQNFTEAIRLSPRYSLAFHGLGLAWKGSGNLEEALEAFKKAIEYAPQYAQGHYDLGEVFLELNQQALARMAFQEVIRLAPHTDLALKAKEKMRGLP